MSETPDISIVVPFFNSERHIRQCVEALLDQDGGHQCEIILVDNGSTDASAAIVAGYDGLTELEEPTPGAYAARNTGIDRATAPLIAFTDADCVVARDWVQSILHGMESPSTAVLVGRCKYPKNASLVLRFIAAYENAKTEHVINHCAPGLHFAYANNMAVRASVFQELGPFEEWTRAADSELVHRLASHRPDLRLVYRDSMTVTHLEFLSARRRVERLLLYTRTNTRIGTFRELDLATRLRVTWRMLRSRRFG